MERQTDRNRETEKERKGSKREKRHKDIQKKAETGKER